MDLITRQLRSQVCVGNTPPMVTATDTTASFYADLSDGTGAIRRRTLTYNTATDTITESVVVGHRHLPRASPSPAPPRASRCSPTSSRSWTAPPPGRSSATTATRSGARSGSWNRSADAALGNQPEAGRADQGRVQVLRRPAAHQGRRFGRARGRRVRPGRGAELTGGRSRMSLIHRCQQGFTTVTLMGVLMVGGLLVAASFAAVQPDIGVHAEGRGLQAGVRRGRGRHQLLHEPPVAGQRLLRQVRPGALAHPERGQPGVERRRSRSAPLPEDPRLQRRVRGRAARGPDPGGRHRAVHPERARVDGRPEDGHVPDPLHRAHADARERRPTRSASAASSRRCGASRSSTSSGSPTTRRSTRPRTHRPPSTTRPGPRPTASSTAHSATATARTSAS